MEVITQREAADRLLVHHATIGKMLDDGRLTAVVRPNQRYRRVDEESVVYWEREIVRWGHQVLQTKAASRLKR